MSDSPLDELARSAAALVDKIALAVLEQLAVNVVEPDDKLMIVVKPGVYFAENDLDPDAPDDIGILETELLRLFGDRWVLVRADIDVTVVKPEATDE